MSVSIRMSGPCELSPSCSCPPRILYFFMSSIPNCYNTNTTRQSVKINFKLISVHFIRSDFNILPFQIRLQFYVKAVTPVQHIPAYVFYTSLTKTWKHLGTHSAMRHKQLLDLSSWRA